MKTRLLCAFALLTARMLFGQQAPVPIYSLDQLVSSALKNNYSLQAKRSAERQAEASVKETRAGLLPQLQALGNYTYYPNLPVSLLPADALGAPAGGYLPVALNTQYQGLIGLDASWAVFNKNLYIANQLAEEGAELARLDTRKEQENLVEQVHYLYYAIYIIDEQIEIAQLNLSNINRLIESSEGAYSAGVIKRTEVDKVAVNRANLESAIRNLITAKNQQVNTLRFLCVIPDSVALEIAEPAFSLTDWQMEPASEQIDLQIIGQRMGMLALERKAAMAGYFPIVQATAGASELLYGTSFGKSFGSEYSYGFQSVGLRVQWTLFDGMQKRHQLSRNRLEREELDYQQALIAADVRLRQQNALEKIEANLASIRSQEANMVLAQRVLEDTQLSNRAGLATITDVLLADNALKQSQNEYFSALANYFVALVELKKANGLLNQE